MTGKRFVWVPVCIALGAAIYMWNLVDLRMRFGTTYNDYFAIPVTALLLVGSSMEVVRALTRLRARGQVEPHRPVSELVRRLVVNPRVRLAVLLVLLVGGFGRIPFIVLCTAVLTLGVAIIDSPSELPAKVSRATFFGVVVGASLILSTLLYLAFAWLGARL